jgi:tripeptide aminopeptidase
MNEKITRKKLLIDVLSIQTTSGNEFDMIAYIHKFCQENVPQAEVVIKDSNIYVTKGKSKTYPCIVAHTDTVHDIHKYYKVFDDDGCIFAFNAETGKQVGVGGDDKVGIWIALEMLMSQDIIKCAFFHSEEIGCIGSSQADMDWFKDVGYCLQADRRGNKDFVNSISGKLFSKAFSKAVAPILKHYGYKETSGAITDVGQLAENGVGVCVANMSCGYYAPHSDEEVVEFVDASNCLDMIESIVEELGNNKYEYQYQTRYHNYYGSSKWGDWSGATRGYWYGESEVVENEEGKETCYYCGCSELMESEYGTEYRYCPDCFSDIMLEETHDPNQIEMFEDEKAWNESFGITDTEYEDISDNYDGSMKHKQIVNEYLTNYQKNK